jgi:hypothetical protein
MIEELTPIELANAKKQARARRIRNIRRRVAIAAATLTALFSGVILARTQLIQPDPQPDQIAMVAPPSGDGDPERAGTVETILTAAAGATQSLVSEEHGDGEHSEDDEEHEDVDEHGVVEQVVNAAAGAAGAVLESGSQSAQSSSGSTSTPAPLVTSQS